MDKNDAETATDRPADSSNGGEVYARLLPEPLGEPSAERAAERIDALYPHIEPRLGKYLTDPNVVLTLADARAQTEVHIDDRVATDAINRLNELAQPQGIRFQPHSYTRRTGEPGLMINVESLAGYQNVSEATRLPGIPRFDPAAGWEGVEAWQKEALAGIQAAAERGEYPPQILDEDKVGHTLVGVMKGYPDPAVMSMITDRPLEDGEEPFMRRTHIPYSDYYDNSQPNYSYDQKDEVAVAPHAAAWGKILEDYYQSPSHQRLAADPEFRAARGLSNEA